jgi:hypothetical protein
MKMPFLRAATRNLSPELSAQSKDFNLKRLLSCVETMADFFNIIGQKLTVDFVSEACMCIAFDQPLNRVKV